MADVPTLETPRLFLRGRTVADFPAYVDMWADPVVTRHVTGKAFTREECWTRFARQEGLWSLMGYGSWAVIDKATGALIGDVGPADYGRDIEPSLAGKPEFGWAIATRFTGQGLATEALGAALAWARENIKAEAYCCIIDSKNAPSLRVAAKVGFERVGVAHYKGATLELFEQRA